ncbi:MAG: dihydrofolate reductase [Halobacteriales archaeon]
MELVAVAAVDDTLAIGRDGELPWPSLPADTRQYRARVGEGIVILGRRTFESMLDDLPGRVQIVLSRHAYDPPVVSARHAPDVASAIELTERYGDAVAYVLGGAAVYEAFLPHLDRLVLSRVPGEHAADAFFPAWDRSTWRLVRTTAFEGFILEEWVRRDEAP